MVQPLLMPTPRDAATRDLLAIKRTLSRTLRARLRQRAATVAGIARDTGTSRTAIRRVLDARNPSITLHSLVRTARSLGLQVRLTLEPSIDRIAAVPAPSSSVPLLTRLGAALDRLPPPGDRDSGSAPSAGASLAAASPPRPEGCSPNSRADPRWPPAWPRRSCPRTPPCTRSTRPPQMAPAGFSSFAGRQPRLRTPPEAPPFPPPAGYSCSIVQDGPGRKQSQRAKSGVCPATEPTAAPGPAGPHRGSSQV